jgi:hypothetical protein
VGFKEENAKINQWIDFRGLTRSDFQEHFNQEEVDRELDKRVNNVWYCEFNKEQFDDYFDVLDRNSSKLYDYSRTRAYNWEEILRLNPKFLEV